MSYFKVIATVEKVSEPKSCDPDAPSHVVLPCRMYKEGDRIVIEDNQINMSETTGALCLSLTASMIPVLKAMQRSVKPSRKTARKNMTQPRPWHGSRAPTPNVRSYSRSVGSPRRYPDGS